jgi:hypothetical protein
VDQRVTADRIVACIREAVLSGRALSRDELSECHDAGVQAAETGAGAAPLAAVVRGAIQVVTTAGPAPATAIRPERLLHVVDDVISAFVDGYDAALRALVRTEEEWCRDIVEGCVTQPLLLYPLVRSATGSLLETAPLPDRYGLPK